MMGMTVPARMLVATLLLLLAGAASGAERRVALVVGNGDYAHTPVLRNPANDATDVAAALRNLGFAVIEGVDLDRNAFEAKLREFAGEARNAETALLFYAGHGMQVDGENYLLPVDARLTEELDLDFEALGLRAFLRQMRSNVNLVFLDACRDNPLARDLARSMGAGRSAAIGRGLGRVDSGSGTLIAYATQPGSIAADGEGRNSPFTAALLRHIAVPGRSVNDMLTAVTSDVATATESRQQPWVHSSLLRPFHFVPPSSAEPSAAADGATRTDTGSSEERMATERLAADRVFWESVKDSTSPADFEAYLGAFSDGVFASLARIRLRQLTVEVDSDDKEEPPVPDGEALTVWRVALQLGNAGPFWSVAFSPDGRNVASGSWDGSVRIWNARSGRLLSALEGHAAGVRSVAFSPDGRTIASGSRDRTVRIWDVESGRQLSVLGGHEDEIKSVAFSPDGRMIASGSSDKSVRIWNAKDGRRISGLWGHRGPVWSVAFSPDGRMFASGSSDGTVRIWNAGTGGSLRVLKGHSRGVRSVAFSPDGRTIASGSDDKSVRIWNAESGGLLWVLKGHSRGVRSVAFSPDGRTIASGSDDKSVRIWNAESGRQTSGLWGHRGLVWSVAFSPDGRTIASGSHDKAVRLWNGQATASDR